MSSPWFGALALAAWVSAGQSKNRRPIAVPLNATAQEVLRRQLGKHRVRVFTSRKQPTGSIRCSVVTIWLR